MTNIETTLQLRYFPHPWDTSEHKQAYGGTTLQQENLSSPELKRGDIHPMRFGFEELRKIPFPITPPTAAKIEKPQP